MREVNDKLLTIKSRANSLIGSLPNNLTYLRLLLVPVFVVLMIDPTETMAIIATVVFVIASLTDYLDGWIARRYKVVSDLGKLLDPLADKILVMSALVMLVAQRSSIDSVPWVPGWLVVIILAREIWVTGIRAIAAQKGRIVAAQGGGKYKSALQMIAIPILIIHSQVEIFSMSLTSWGLNLLVVSLAFSLWSGVDYTLSILAPSTNE